LDLVSIWFSRRTYSGSNPSEGGYHGWEHYRERAPLEVAAF
jgi:hypothetical protein